MERLPRTQASRETKASVGYRRAAKKFGLRVRKLRTDSKLTLQAAADAMELDLKHVQKIEAGTINLTLVTIYRIAKGLGVTMNELFYDPPPVPSRSKKDPPFGYNPRFTKKRIKPKPF